MVRQRSEQNGRQELRALHSTCVPQVGQRTLRGALSPATP